MSSCQVRIVTALLLILTLSGCGINNIPAYDEQVKAAWSQVENQYQRRSDLIPNLVEVVKGYAAHERETLTAVVEARARVGGLQATPDLLNNPEAQKKFIQAQSELGNALQRLMVVVERYPDLKANQNFLALQSQLEGTENRISVARRDYITSIQAYNTELRTFPGRIWHSLLYSDMKVRENYYTATTEKAQKAPQIKF